MGNDRSDTCPEEVLASRIAADRKLAIAQNEVRAANYERQEQWSQAWQPLCCRDGEFLGKWDPSLIPSVLALAELIQAFGHSDVLDSIVQRIARWIEHVKVPEEYESPAISFRGNESNEGFSGFMKGILATAIVLSRAVKGELQIVPDGISSQLLNAGSWGDLRLEILTVPPDHPIDPILKRRKTTCIRCGVTSEADAKKENSLFDICEKCNRIEGKLISVYLALAHGDPDRIAQWPSLRASLCKKFGYLGDDLDLYKLLLDWLLNEKGIDDQAANNLSIDEVIEWLTNKQATIIQPSVTKPKDLGPNRTEKKYLRLLEDYHEWQQSQFEQTGRRRYNESEWMAFQDRWKRRTKSFFEKMDHNPENEDDHSGSILLSQLLENARKIRLKYYGQNSSEHSLLFDPPFRRKPEILPK